MHRFRSLDSGEKGRGFRDSADRRYSIHGEVSHRGDQKPCGRIPSKTRHRVKELSTVLENWNRQPVEQAIGAIFPCCGSQAWARGMAAHRPLQDETALLAASDETWQNLTQADWLEAFQSHPRIEESHVPQVAPSQAATWSAHEQKRIADADAALKIALEEGNREYEQRFDHIF